MGTYSGTVTIGIVLNNPTLQNPTTVTSTGSVTNSNTAVGDAVYGDSSAAWTLTNFGTINATVTYSDGVDLRAGGLVINQTGASIIGPDGVQISGTVGTVLNDGTITGTNEYGIRLENGGTVSNGTGTAGSAVISGNNAGILLLFDGGTVNNGHLGFSAATITGGTYGVWSLNAAANVTNYGTIVGTSGAGIFLYNGGTVTNAAGGVVTSSNGGIQIRNAVGSVDNTGTVQSTNLAVSLASGAVTNRQGGTIAGGAGVQISGQGTLANLGTITGGATTGFAVGFSLGGSVENGSSAATDALLGGTLRGVQIYGTTGTVTNFGTITASITYAAALYLQGGGGVTNQASGLIQGGGVGIVVTTSAGTVANLGTVSGVNTTGIVFGAGGSINNSGLIFGGNYGINLAGAAGTVTNSGTIASTGTGVRLAATTLTNSGTIAGDNGIAVYFVGGINRLIVAPGAVFTGTAFGGTTDDTLQLGTGGAVGTIAGLGSSFSGFEQIAVDASAAWLLSGYNLLGAGTTLSDAGTLTLAGTFVNEGAIGVAAGAALVLDGVVSGGGTIDFPGVGGGTLEIGGTVMPSGTITGVEPGDAFRLADVPFDAAGTAVVLAGNVLRIHENGSNFDLQLGPGEDFTGKFFHLASNAGGTLVTEDTTPCFCRGTLILTDRGEVAVEALSIGDRVVTLSGEARRIKWIGRRAYHPRFVAGKRGVLPIRIIAGALADGVPARDLLVSPEHALYIGNRLLPARLLTNEATIRQVESVDSLEYFHIELDTHDVILAEGAPAETFIDCGGRGVFQNATEFSALYPDDQPADAEGYLALMERHAAAVTEVRSALMRRAARMGLLVRDPGLHLRVDRQTIRAQMVAGRVHRFAVAAGARDMAIASRSVIPADTEADSSDLRQLGVALERIVLRSADLEIAIEHDHPALCDGFHDSEGTHSWTDGRAVLPTELLDRITGDFSVEVHIWPAELHYPEVQQAAAQGRPAAADPAEASLPIRALGASGR